MLTLIAQTIKEIPFDISGEAVTSELPGTSWIAGGPDAGFAQLVSVILTAVFAIAGLLLLLYLIWGGIDWITSGGDSGKVSTARNKMTQAVIGVLVLASAFAIVYTVESIFDLDLLMLTPPSSSTSTTTSPTKTFEKKSGLPATIGPKSKL